MKRFPISLGILVLVTLLLPFRGAPPALADPQATIYVDYAATGANDGTSWFDAYTSLSIALAAVPAGQRNDMWVARGLYRLELGADRDDSYVLADGVSIYGGFAGTETALEQRDPVNNKTVLSGDIDRNDTTDADGVTLTINGDNSYHVLRASVTVSGTVASGYVIDGVVITGGDADGLTPHDQGGGMLNANGSPVLNNVTFVGNRAGAGGGMFNENGQPLLNNVTFKDNSAELGGGGMFNYNGGDAQMTNVTFINNRTAGGGGGMANSSNSSPALSGGVFLGNVAGDDATVGLGGGLYNEFESSPLLVNSVFSGNTATGYGGAIFSNQSSLNMANNTMAANQAGIFGGGIFIAGNNLTLTLINHILYDNADSRGTGQEAQIMSQTGVTIDVRYSLVGGSSVYPGTGNINGIPQFVNLSGLDGSPGTFDDNLRLKNESPAIDAGDNNAVPGGILVDADGNPRFQELIAVPDTGNGTAPIVDMGAYEVISDDDSELLNISYLPTILLNN